ncbi:hypothetical protein MRX96_058434 [Rhipicephalus microplus]
MPMDLELVLSANPPLFVGSECRLSVCALQQSNPLFQTCSIKRNYRRASTNVPPIKPCMSPRDEQIQSEPTSPTSSNRIKRRVSFADDKGYSLTQVRVMKEPSDSPPRWTDEFVARITRDMRLDAPLWETAFTQPASDYFEFRQTLDTNLVSLENVIVKSDELITGTIKVKNVTFEKRVFVRATFDGWKTMQDFAAEYVGQRPPKQHVRHLLLLDSHPAVGVEQSRRDRVLHALKADVDSWTEFASWKNLASEGPYW